MCLSALWLLIWTGCNILFNSSLVDMLNKITHICILHLYVNHNSTFKNLSFNRLQSVVMIINLPVQVYTWVCMWVCTWVYSAVSWNHGFRHTLTELSLESEKSNWIPSCLVPLTVLSCSSLHWLARFTENPAWGLCGHSWAQASPPPRIKLLREWWYSSAAAWADSSVKPLA